MTAAKPKPPLLTIEQVAERLNTKVSHVRTLVAARQIPYVKVGRLLRFPEDDVERWLEANYHAAVA